jgi:oxygen-dependent protoporphyrinogen oxidase
VRTFLVADQARELLNAPHETVIEQARADLGKFMGLNAGPRFARVHYWPDSMPQYVVGHARRYRRISEALDDAPGLSLTGNAYSGVGIPDCIELAKQTAKRFAPMLREASDS